MAADEGGAFGAGAVLVVSVAEFVSASVAGETDGVVGFGAEGILGFNAVFLCHADGYAAFP